jgi:hypothetical protein
MRVISSIVAVLVLASFPLALRIWREVDPHFSSRDQIVGPLAILFALTGLVAAVIAIVLAAKRRPVSAGFSVYAILHGAACLYLTWSWDNGPGVFDVLAGISICIGLRAVAMMRKKHEQAT